MTKNKLKLGLLVALVLMFLFGVQAAMAADLTFSEDTNVSIGGNTYVILSGSTATSLIIGNNDITVTLAGGDTFTLKSTNRYLFNTNPTLGQTCSTNDNRVVVIGPVTSQVITPNTSVTCSLPGGGSGYTPPPTPTVPTTTTGEVTANASAGGKTTLTTAEGTQAVVELPANAVTADTTIKVETAAVATVTATAPAPTGKTAVNAFNLTATSAGLAVTSFAANVTVTFTYTDAQIAGLNETALKIYRYDGTQWVALTTTVNAATNTLTAFTTTFSFFAIMGEPLTVEPEVPPTEWTPPAGYEYITGPSKMSLYKNIITEPGTHKKYGILKSLWTPPTGYEYISGPSKMSLYKNIITEPGTKKKYGILKTKWTPPTGYEYITGPSKIKLYKNIITEPGTAKKYGILKK